MAIYGDSEVDREENGKIASQRSNETDKQENGKITKQRNGITAKQRDREIEKYKTSDNSIKNFPVIVLNSESGKYRDTKMQDTHHRHSTDSPAIV